MKHFNKKEKILFVFAVVAVLAVMVTNMNDIPVIKGPSNLNRKVLLKKKMIAQALQLIDNKDIIMEESRKYADYLKSEGTEEEEAQALIKEIEDLAQYSAIELADIKPFPREQKEHYSEYKLEVEAEAQMTDLIQFIYDLQVSESILRVLSFRIAPTSYGDEYLKANLIISKIFID